MSLLSICSLSGRLKPTYPPTQLQNFLSCIQLWGQQHKKDVGLFE